MDESGVLASDVSQPYFAIGFLFVDDTSELVEALSQVKAEAKAGLVGKGRDFEFKFKRVTYETVSIYEKLIDIALSGPVRIVVFFLDKTDPRIDVARHFKGTWEAYIGCAKLVIRNRMKSGNKCIVVADYLLRPKVSTRYFEREVSKLGQVLNATMLESHASMLIQAIDVLTGCVNYQLKRKSGIVKSKGGKVKMRLAKYLAKKLGRTTLAEDFKVISPVSFEVWKFSPK
jgi:hypothetical protein